jgi:hypothetical protein
MIIRKLATRGKKRAASRRKEPRRNRAWLFLLVTSAAGVGSWIAALIGTSLLVNVGTLVTDVGAHDNGPQPIEARAAFPPVPPVHKVINVYDPPAAGPSAPASKPRPHSPTPTPDDRPSPSPTPHDDGGGDD